MNKLGFAIKKTMKSTRKQYFIAIALLAAVAFTTTLARDADPLPSWNDGPPKQSIVEFVRFVTKVTRVASPDFVPAIERYQALEAAPGGAMQQAVP